MSKFKLIIKSLLPQKFLNFYHELKIKNKKYYGQNKMDKKLLKYFNYNNGFFIELGANDGLRQSNTYYLEKNLGWRGILIEPEKKNFLKCKKNRSTKNFYFNVACQKRKNQKKMKFLYSDLMTISLDSSNNIKNPYIHAEKGKLYLQNNEKIKKFNQNTMTLSEILNICDCNKVIDFLSLDVEGMELDVLKGVNFSKFNFKYILTESYDNKKIKSYLKSKNYRYIKKLSKRDLLFKYTY